MSEESKIMTDESSNSTALTINNADLNKESLAIINQVIAETNITKTQELTDLFNLNQKKKTMVRVNKLNELLDVITDQAIARFTQRPDEISNQELLQGLKTAQDALERGQNSINNKADTPLIQINQQTNEVNVGTPAEMSRESRDRVKTAVASILAGIAGVSNKPAPSIPEITPIIDESIDSNPGDNNND